MREGSKLAQLDSTTQPSITIAEDKTCESDVRLSENSKSKPSNEPSNPSLLSSCSESVAIVERLDIARRQGQLRLRRLRGPTLFLGFACEFVGAGTFILGLMPVPAFNCAGLPFLLAGFVILLASLVPTDVRAVPILISFGCIPFLSSGAIFALLAASRSYNNLVSNDCRLIPNCAEDDDYGTDVPCWLIVFEMFLKSNMALVDLVILCRVIKLLKDRVSSPVFLQRAWRLMFWACFFYGSNCIGLCFNCLYAARVLSGIIFLINAISAFAFAVLSRRSDIITRIQSWLMSRGESATIAAGIAELLGGVEPERLLARARESFSGIPSGKLTFDDMLSNKPDPALAAFTQKARLGQVDAFVSHSWHDDPEEKWAALQDWIRAFKADKKREPVLWIDKYCIDQRNVEENLQCLPVYIAGCQKLLVLCGTTYLRRLWCIMEVFIFQQMCGDASRLNIELLRYRRARASMQVDDNSMQKLQEEVLSFDPRKARCFTEYDTMRLRNIVDLGGGGMDSLGEFIRDHFVTKVEARALDKREWMLEREWRRAVDKQEWSREDWTNLERSIEQTHWMESGERQQLLAEAKRLRSWEGAQLLHTTLPARYWGITKAQILELVETIKQRVESGTLKNTFPPDKPYSDASFYRFGPTAHQVNQQYIKPQTDAGAPRLPYASYAVAKNSEEGMDCDLFLSHAWDEGLFEFGKTVSEAWPAMCSGAYLCFLANPQHLDIASLVESPTVSPFYQVLEAGPKIMQMVSNQNSIVHSRLWCVFEAFCAHQFDIPVSIAGDPLLLIVAEKRETAQLLLSQVRAGNTSSRSVDALLAEVGVDVHSAQCFSDNDRRRIWDEIGPHAYTINMMIKELIATKFLE